MEDHAFLLRLLEFFAALCSAHHGHFVEGFEADHVNFLRACANGRARDVQRGLHFADVNTLFVFGPVVTRLFQTRAQSHSRGVERHKAAADDQNLLAQAYAVTVVDIDQVINGLDYAVEIGAFDHQVAAFLYADTQEDRFVAFFAQFLQAELRGERRVVANLDAELLDLADLLLDDRARQPKFGNPVKHHPARLIG